jgi:flagellar FliJ protein
MGRFRFRMQNILGIKEKIEEQEKQAFAMAASKLAEEEELLELCKQKKEELEEKARELRRKKIDVLKLKESEALLKYQDEVIKAQLVKVRAAQKNLETQRIKMQKAVQERKTYDILRDKAFEEFMKDENAAEAKEIDQLTSYTYCKKTKDN